MGNFQNGGNILLETFFLPEMFVLIFFRSCNGYNKLVTGLVIDKSDSRFAVVRFCKSLSWLQARLDSTWSYYHYKSPLRALRREVEATSLENRQALQFLKLKKRASELKIEIGKAQAEERVYIEAGNTFVDSAAECNNTVSFRFKVQRHLTTDALPNDKGNTDEGAQKESAAEKNCWVFEQARKSRCTQSHRAKADVRIKAEVTQCNGQNYENPRLGDNYRGFKSLLEPRH